MFWQIWGHEDVLCFLLVVFFFFFSSYIQIFEPFWVHLCLGMWDKGTTLFFACGYPVVPALFVEKIILSPLNGLGTLLKNQLTFTHSFVSDSQFYAIELCVLSCTTLTFTAALVVRFEKGSVNFLFCSFSRLLWPLQVCNSMNFRINSSVSPKKSTGIWQGLHWVCSSGDLTI